MHLLTATLYHKDTVCLCSSKRCTLKNHKNGKESGCNYWQTTMSAHVNSVCRSAYYQLRQLRPVVRSLSADAARTIVQAFVSSGLDYCNSVMYGVADGLMQRLQAVQNAAVRLVTGTRRRDHITPVLRQLHWLPVRQRVNLSWPFLSSRRCTA